MNRQQAVVELAETKRTQKEQDILNVASDYFLSHGYQGTSINGMSRDSGISKESIYRYFSSKKALFEAVISKELREYRSRLKFLNFESDTMSLESALEQAAVSILRSVSSDRVLGLRRLIFQESVQSPDIGITYYEIGPRRAYDHLEHVFSEHKDETDFEPINMAHYFVSMVLHAKMLRRDCGVQTPLSEAEIEQHASQVCDDFLKAFFHSNQAAGK